VWADGLGSPYENGLPEYQVIHLYNLLTQTKWKPRGFSGLRDHLLWRGSWMKDKYIWLDTFCIPPTNSLAQLPDLDHVKRMAIHSMNLVYADSIATLVLDFELQQNCISSTETSKLLAYIHCCGWGTRAWTLQEGGMSRETIFALGNEITTLCEYHWRGYDPKTLVAKTLVDAHLAGKLDVWGTGRYYGANNANLYAKTWNELLQRTSGEAADIPAILANILGTSAYKTLQQSTEAQRIGVLIRQQRVLPIGILYNTGPRVQANICDVERGAVSQSQPRFSYWRWARSSPAPDLESGAVELALDDLGRRDSPVIKNLKNRWAPSAIAGDRRPLPPILRAGRDTAVEMSHLLISKGDRLHMYKSGKNGPMVFISNQRTIPSTDFVLKSMASQQDQYRIQPKHQLGDELVMVSMEDISIGYCFIMHRESINLLKAAKRATALGALLRILKGTRRHKITIFECPIRITLVTDNSDLDVVGARPGAESIDIPYGRTLSITS
jgi:hypothetical protein